MKTRLIFLLLVIVGLVLLGFGVKEKIAIKNCTPIQATITGEKFEEEYDATENRTTTYRFPIYTYTLNGEEIEYKAAVSDEKTPIGAEVTLYLDDSGKIHEQANVMFYFLAGSLTTVVSLIAFFVSGRRRYA